MLTKSLAERVLHGLGWWNRMVGDAWSRPLLYFLYLTSRCNFRCSYCWQTQPARDGDRGRRTTDELNADEWCRVVERIPRSTVIGFSGGEPFLVEGLPSILQCAVRGGRRTTINTNGVLMDASNAEMLIDLRVRNVSVSLDGFADVHDTSRNAAGSFERVVANLTELRERKAIRNSVFPAVTIKTTLVPEGVDRIEEFCRFCARQLGADTVNISLVKSNDHAQFSLRLYDSFSDLASAGIPESIHYPDADRVGRVIAALRGRSEEGWPHIQIYPKLNSCQQVGEYLAARGHDVYRRCDMPWAMIVAMPGGDVIPCLSTTLGNLRDANYDFREILRGDRSKRFRHDLRQAQRGGRTPHVCSCCCFLRGR